ncbi:autotransporter domain-containing protein [Pontiella agarivorans]|uniref:Autotransporter domain-containing protein n=1 Tax=Pontiella agarivorans TaxID=3038953 RepID=A0ABU5N059_9BACT|nr:autotransporter domain-containing protein [Pontiella agarivorans]MDZ8119804.1 autotransporter domain-containing protein [Pontiella agarivorans]
MKKQSIVIFSLICSMSSMAIYQGPSRKAQTDQQIELSWNARFSYNSGGENWSNTLENQYSGSWVFGIDDTTVEQTSGGNVNFTRGGATTDPTTLYLKNNVSGYIGGVNNGGSQTTSTTVLADPGTTFSGSDRAIVLMTYSTTGNGGSHGNWEFIGGDYSGANEAAYIESVGSIVFDSVTFSPGSGGYSAVQILNSSSTTIKNSRDRNDISYIASDASSGDGRSGLHVGGGTGAVSGGGTFIGGDAGGGDSSLVNNTSEQEAFGMGGSGMYFGGAVTFSGSNSYTFAAGDAADATVGGTSSEAWANGGSGASVGSAKGNIDNSIFRGANGGEAEVLKLQYLTAKDTIVELANDSKAFAHGGSGLFVGSGSDTLILNNADASGGTGGSAIVAGTNSYADASGGNGVTSGGNLVINQGFFKGGNAGSASARDGEAYAIGGSGVYASGTVEINGGSFTAGKGGTATTSAFDGAGVTVIDGELDINGGTFKGTSRSSRGLGYGNALWLQDSDLTIDESVADTVIEGNILINDSTGTSATFDAGHITGDIIKIGSGTTALSISENASYTGSFIQDGGGAVDVSLTSTNESKFFSNVDIYDGDLSFSGQEVVTMEGAQFTLYSTNNNTLSFNNGATLSQGTLIDAGFNTASSTGDLNLKKDSTIRVAYDVSRGLEGNLTVTGGDLNFEEGSKFIFDGIADVASGTKKIATADNVGYTGDINDFIDVNFGWLTAVDTNATSTAGGITVSWNYNSLTNSSLSDLDENVLLHVDSVILSTNVDFYSLNAAGQTSGEKLFRYNISQLPDASEAVFQSGQQVNKQIAARGTEFRSMNGFASTKPDFAPEGVAGPTTKTDEEKTMQGWVRVYGSKGNRDAENNFVEYDSTAWGTVIGVDKSFGNLLAGVAGGYGRTDIDAGTAYQSDIETYHGSIYSTYGGESLFIDLALTYGWGTTEEQSDIVNKGEFDYQTYSLYAGAGYAFDLGGKIALTPEASLLASFYDQDEFSRTSILGDATVKEYDTSSYLGSIGVNLATQHQIDWLNRGIAYIPEVRAHYIHEFNADPDDFTYVIGGTAAPFAVRPRDENIFRVGFGLDMWSWKYMNSKFEIDYDALFSDTYWEHIVSGKVTWRF